MPERPLLICDLDETLLAGNSFRLLVRELVRPWSWWALGPSIPVALLVLVVRRLGRRLDRVAFTKEVHAVVRRLSGRRRARLESRMATVLDRQVRIDVKAAIEMAREVGFCTVLATAAFADHAIPLARRHGFDAVVATTWPDDPDRWCEVRGVAKREAVVSAGEGLGVRRPWLLLSDHEDDEPLADVCDRVFWVDRRTAIRGGTTNEEPFTRAAFGERLRSMKGDAA